MSVTVADPPEQTTLKSAALPFADLLEALHRQGFEIGVDHYVRLQALLERMGGECEPAQLRTLLCPVFATSRETQEQFYRVFDQQYALYLLPVANHAGYAEDAAGVSDFFSNPGGLPAHPGELPIRFAPDGVHGGAPVTGRTRAGKPKPTLLRAQTLALSTLLLAVVIVGGLSVLGPFSSSETIAPADQSPTRPDPKAGRPDSAGVTPSTVPPNVPDSLRLPSTDVAPAPLPAPPVAATTRPAWIALLIPSVIIALPLVLFGLYEWYRFRRRKLLLHKQRGEKPPFVWPVRVPTMRNPYSGSDELYQAARLLRQREPGAEQRLALEETITATIAARGYPTFRYRSDSRPPDYIVLVERATFRDHQAELFSNLSEALEREGVHITRYYYDGDPRVCYAEPGEQGVLLVDLHRKYPTHRLLMFGTGERLINPISGRLHSWVETCVGWSDRALLTPELPANWAQRELTLARSFMVLPATVGGLRAVREHFDNDRNQNGSPNGSRFDFPASADPRVAVHELRSYLGLDAFRWLCVSALYPELYWDLTLYLGSLPALNGRVINEENLLKLIRLPWFRAGSIPDDLRAALIQQLEPDIALAARKAIIDLMEQNPPPPDAIAATRYRLELAVQRLALTRGDRKQQRALVQEVQALPRKQVLHDRGIIALLEQAPHSRLALVLPQGLRRVFYEGGIPALGWRMAARASLAATFTMTAVLGVAASYANNARLESTVRSVSDRVATVAPSTTMPTLDDLRALDSLRSQVARLGGYEKSGPPLRMRFGQYRGSALYGQARQAYFAAFDKLLWNPTRMNLTKWLAALPPYPAPNSDFERTYEALKAYLVTTQYPDSARRDFLVPALFRFSSLNGATDSVIRALGARQFAFFAGVLTEQDQPLVGPADVALVERTRSYLRAFAAENQLYSYLLSVAGERLTSVSFSDGPVRSATVVPAAFTAPAWQKAQAALADIERLFNREPWVVGESGIRRVDRVRLEATLRERYTAEYVDHWIRYLSSGSVSLGSREQAANTLGLLAGPASPMLRMIAQVSNNTAVDTVRMAKVFKPAHALVAPKSTATTENANKYLSALINVQGPLNVVAATPEDAAAVAQLNTAIGQARAVVNSIILAFDQQGRAREVGAAVGSLLMAPLNHSATIVARIGPGILNQKGREFCSGIQQALRGKYPFNRGGADATIEDLGVLAPNVITNFYLESLAAHLSRTPTGFQIRGGGTRISPLFRDYLNYLNDLSSMLYSGRDTPYMQFQLRLTVPPTVTEVTANILGQVLRATPTQPAARTVTWAAGSSPLQIRATLKNQEQVVYVDEPSGLWSVFRMMYAADAQRQGPTGYVAVLKQPGKPDITLFATFEASKPHPVFSPDWVGRVNRCVSQIAL